MESFRFCKSFFRRISVGQNLRLLAALLIGFFLGSMALPIIRAGDLYEYQDTVGGAHLPEVDAIVILAGGRGRIAAAGDLWYRYWEVSQKQARPGNLKVPAIYVSGMGSGATFAVFKKQLRSGVRDVIKPENVIIENESFNTEANARWLARYLHREAPWKKVIVVTSPYHMRRAQHIFQKVLYTAGHRIQIETHSAFQEPFEPGEWRTSIHGIHVTLVEYFKWIYYRYFWEPVAPI